MITIAAVLDFGFAWPVDPRRSVEVAELGINGDWPKRADAKAEASAPRR
jgi:hypothetical protein